MVEAKKQLNWEYEIVKPKSLHRFRNIKWSIDDRQINWWEVEYEPYQWSTQNKASRWDVPMNNNEQRINKNLCITSTH